MKIYEGIRQSGQTYNMIQDLHMKIRRDSLLPNNKNQFLILFVTPKATISDQLRKKAIEKIWGDDNAVDKYSYTKKTIRIVDGSISYDLMIATTKETTLHDLLTPDYVIIDDTFTHHPFNERIMIRGTVEPA